MAINQGCDQSMDGSSSMALTPGSPGPCKTFAVNQARVHKNEREERKTT